MSWRWWHWVVIGTMLLCVAIWAVMFSVLQSELPRRQELPAVVEPKQVVRGGTITLDLALRPDPNCRMFKTWRMVDFLGAVILTDAVMAMAEEATTIPIHKEYIIPTTAAIGSAVLDRRVYWECNIVQTLTQPSIALEPVSVEIVGD